MLRSVEARLSAGFAVLLVAILAVVLVRFFSGPELLAPPHGGTQWQPHVHQGDRVTVGALTTCLKGSGSVTIDDVTAVDPHGVEVTGWAIRDNPSWPGHESPTTGRGQIPIATEPLASYQFPTSHVVDVQCGHPNKGEGVEIGVEMEKTSETMAGATAFDVVYSDGRTRTLTFPVAVRLCTHLCPG